MRRINWGGIGLASGFNLILQPFHNPIWKTGKLRPLSIRKLETKLELDYSSDQNKAFI
jgi:hypothetical protein